MAPHIPHMASAPSRRAAVSLAGVTSLLLAWQAPNLGGLTLAPGNKISGGKVLSSRTRRSANRATVLLRMAAVGVGRSTTALGAFFRRLAARIGKAKAVTATARKIALIFYNTLRCGAAYVDRGVDSYESGTTRRGGGDTPRVRCTGVNRRDDDAANSR